VIEGSLNTSISSGVRCEEIDALANAHELQHNWSATVL